MSFGGGEQATTSTGSFIVIVKSISLHNFMSYADLSLDLTSVRLACLSGANGAGKSALLDSITWALWERARSSSDDLIRVGQSEMWVDIVFSYEGNTYRIRRSRQKRASKKGGRGTTRGTLELQVLAAVTAQAKKQVTGGEGRSSALAGVASSAREQEETKTATLAANTVRAGFVATTPAAPEQLADLPAQYRLGHWKSLTGATMRDTQKVINELLRMDFDTFINSAYLKQGRADEFTTRSPTERKQVLCEILGLAYFDRLKEACRLKARECKARIDILSESLAEGPELVDTLEETEKELTTQSESLARLAQESESAREQLREHSDRYKELLLARQRKESCMSQVDELREDVATLQKQEKELEENLNELIGLIEESEEIQERAARFSEVRKRVEQLDGKALQAQKQMERRLSLQSQLASARSRLEVMLKHEQDELASLKQSRAELVDSTANSDSLEAAYEEYTKLLEEESELSVRQENFVALSRRQAELESSINEIRIKLEAELHQKESAIEELVSLQEGEETLQKQKEELLEQMKELDASETRLELVEKQGLSVNADIKALEQEQKELARRRKETQEKIDELIDHDHTSICPLCSGPIVDRAAVVKRYEQLIESIDKETEETRREQSRLTDEREELRDVYRKLKERLNGRKELDKRIGQFNERDEAIARARRSLESARKERDTLAQRLADKDYAQVERESLVGIKAEIHKLDFDPAVHNSMQSQIRAKRHIESRFQKLKRDLKELARVDEKLPGLEANENKYASELSAESYAPEIRTELADIREELERLGYDRDEHARLKDELSELLPFSEKLRELTRALTERPRVEESLSSTRNRFAEKLELMKSLESEIAGLDQSIKELPELETKVEAMEKASARLLDEKQECSRKLAVTESRREQLEQSLADLEKKKKSLDTTREERDDLIFLADAFGKKGIQAAIIENAIPEIESEANRILSRLSDSKMHVALVTRQKTKSGTISETLDILIGDEVGTRSYELYSGGEAFKVNFAIRIALARLLARRAGARLETLILDEGFGSQDDVSRQRLIKSIKAIQSDFSKILVITHFSDVREMFPTQIHVFKEKGVSRLEVV